MLKKIIVPTDFSACANNAVEYAVQSAKILPVEIIVLHSFDVKEDLYTDYMGVNKEFNQIQLNEAINKLEMLKNSIKEKEGIDITTIVSKKSLQKALRETVETDGISLIIMGTTGAHGIRRMFFGSNTSATIGNSQVPVMMIPCNYHWKKPEKIVFATNRFEKEKFILDFLFEMADLFMAKVEVVVFSEEVKKESLIYAEDSRNLSEYENMISKKYNEKNLSAMHLTGNDFKQSLSDYIEDNDIDILAMVKYERGFWEDMFHRSLTKSMSYHTKIALLAIPARQ